MIRFVRAVVLAGLMWGVTSALAHDGPHGPGAAPPALEGIDVEISPQGNPWTHLALLNDPDNFQFAIVTDNSGNVRPGVFAEAIDKLNLMRPQFVISVGDLIEGYTEDRAEIDRQWKEFQGYVNRLEMPFFYVVGNHDYSNEVMAEEYRRRFGKPYYHFIYRNVLFICLNSDDPPGIRGSIGQQQVQWVRKVLRDNADVRWTMVFLHRPMWVERASDPGGGWEAIEKMLKERKHTVFAGHLHNYRKLTRDGSDYITLATTGGGAATLAPDIAADAMKVILGRFDHFAWVTMTDDGPEIANVLLDGVWSRDVRTDEVSGWTNRLLNRVPVYLDPIESDGPFTQATTTLHAINDSNVTLRMRAEFEPHAQLAIDPPGVYLDLPPRTSRKVPVTIAARSPTDPQELLPMKLHWSLEYATSEMEQYHRDFRLRSTSRYAILPVLQIARRRSPVTIDGKLDEWSQLPFVVEQPAEVVPDPRHWQGPADASFRFAVEHDEEFLYIAVRVVDDQLVLDRSRVPARATPVQIEDIELDNVDGPLGFTRALDGIEIIVDARPEPLRSLERGTRPLSTGLFVAMHPGRTLDDMIVHRRNRLPRGVRVACVQSEEGYTAELVIPFAWLDEQQGGRWSRARINIAVNDLDEDEPASYQLSWQPTWTGQRNIVGSGTFQR